MPTPAGGELFFPTGIYRLTRPIRPQRACILRGESAHVQWPSTQLRPDDGVPAIIVDGLRNPDYSVLSIENAAGATPADPYYRTAGPGGCDCRIEGLWIQYTPGVLETPAVILRTFVMMKYVRIESCRGIAIEAHGDVKQGSNVAYSHFEDLWITQSSSHGIRVMGPDANACVGINVAVTSAGLFATSYPVYGILDSSQLGGTWISCMIHQCPFGYGTGGATGGAFGASGVLNASTFRSCYVEGDCGPSLVGLPACVVDGLGSGSVIGLDGTENSASWQRMGERMMQHYLEVTRENDVEPPIEPARVSFGDYHQAHTGKVMSFYRGDEERPSAGLRLKRGHAFLPIGGDWLQWGQNPDVISNYSSMMLPFSDATFAGHASTEVFFPPGIRIGGSPHHFQDSIRVVATAGVPIAGHWDVGTIAINVWVDDRSADPRAVPWQGGLLWRCIQAGDYDSGPPPVWRPVVIGASGVAVPASSSDSTGQIGDIASDASFVYVKTSAGWRRAALGTF